MSESTKTFSHKVTSRREKIEFITFSLSAIALIIVNPTITRMMATVAHNIMLYIYKLLDMISKVMWLV